MSVEVGVLILAAGKGTRMKSNLPKVLHKLAGFPLVAHVIDTALILEPKRLVLVVGFQAELVERKLREIFSDVSPPLEFALQREQLGTAHAVMSAGEFLEQFPPQVLLLYGDVPLLTAQSLEGLLEEHVRRGAKVSLLSFFPPDPKGFGRIIRDSSGRPIAIREDKDCSEEERAIRECNSGIYVFDREFLLYNLSQVDRENRQGEFYLTDLIAIASKSGEEVFVKAVEHWSEVMGVNDRVQLSELEAFWMGERRRELMASGVTLNLPETIFIGYRAVIGRDSHFSPGVYVGAGAEVGEGCELGPNCVVGEGARLGAGCKVGAGVYVGAD